MIFDIILSISFILLHSADLLDFCDSLLLFHQEKHLSHTKYHLHHTTHSYSNLILHIYSLLWIIDQEVYTMINESIYRSNIEESVHIKIIVTLTFFVSLLFISFLSKSPLSSSIHYSNSINLKSWQTHESLSLLSPKKAFPLISFSMNRDRCFLGEFWWCERA